MVRVGGTVEAGEEGGRLGRAIVFDGNGLAFGDGAVEGIECSDGVLELFVRQRRLAEGAVRLVVANLGSEHNLSRLAKEQLIAPISASSYSGQLSDDTDGEFLLGNLVEEVREEEGARRVSAVVRDVFVVLPLVESRQDHRSVGPEFQLTVAIFDATQE